MPAIASLDFCPLSCMSDLHEGCAFAGDSYLVLDRPLSALVQHIAKTLNKQIHCNCPVSRIQHDSDGALVSLYGGRYVMCIDWLLTLILQHSPRHILKVVQ